jgi:hypothetical protein
VGGGAVELAISLSLGLFNSSSAKFALLLLIAFGQMVVGGELSQA